MVRRTLPLLASLVLAGVAPALGAPPDISESLEASQTGPASPLSDGSPELSLRYSGVVAGDELLSGWQASCVVPFRSRRLGLVLDAGGYYVQGGAGHVLLAGPRVAKGVGQRTALFAQLMAGALFIDDAQLFVALPGAGVDVALGRNLALRAQVDWPVIGQGGVAFSLARVSLGLVLHPALVRKPRP